MSRPSQAPDIDVVRRIVPDGEDYHEFILHTGNGVEHPVAGSHVLKLGPGCIVQAEAGGSAWKLRSFVLSISESKGGIGCPRTRRRRHLHLNAVPCTGESAIRSV